MQQKHSWGKTVRGDLQRLCPQVAPQKACLNQKTKDSKKNSSVVYSTWQHLS